MRRLSTGQNSGIVVESAAALAVREILIPWLGVFATLSILFLASRGALAETAAPDPLPNAVAIASDAQPTPAMAAVKAERARPEAGSLDALLAIRGPSPLRSPAQLADESIAAAVERGTNTDLLPRSAFRRRNNDLFRTERPLAIGEQEMLIRLRVRAKMREAMSVEVQF